MTRRYVILGNGIAGQTCAEELRALDADCAITMVAAERHPLYNRVALPRYLRGQVRREKVFMRTAEDYAAKGIEIHFETWATEVDAQAKVVRTNRGQELPYDALLVATGGRPKPPPWAGVEQRYAAGSIIKGQVTSLTSFGAFVQLEPGVEGLLHVSELSWKERVTKPEEMLKPKDEVAVKVLSVDTQKEKISLSLKRAGSSPWDKIKGQYPIGSRIKGPITHLTPFGAFIMLPEGIEGNVRNMTSRGFGTSGGFLIAPCGDGEFVCVVDDEEVEVFGLRVGGVQGARPEAGGEEAAGAGAKEVTAGDAGGCAHVSSWGVARRRLSRSSIEFCSESPSAESTARSSTA